MRLSEAWLRSWCNPQADRQQLAHQLTMAGLEVEAIEPVAAEFSGVVVGEIIAVEPHPNADKLRVCTVNVGEKEPLSIVCGAPNAAVGLRAPTALVGARLPGIKIKKSKLRGVDSSGMLCSASELGLTESASGLMELPLALSPGEDFRTALALDDYAFEIGLTPNRGDCLSVAGVAREVGVIQRLAVEAVTANPVAATITDSFAVTVINSAACPRYLGRVIRGINRDATTPLWMQERLRRSNLRSLGPLVDVTNYVMLELGQPMHAFDLDRLQGGITVRNAKEGERLELLNESEINLTPGSLLIADESGPLALAGIMGGERSGISATTTNLFLESAFFAPEAIAGRARSYGLHTDASHRYERGVSPELPAVAMERATALLLEICGGEVGPVIACSSENDLPTPPTISLRRQRLEKLLGMTLDDGEVTDILQRLELQLQSVDTGWEVTPPPFRFDLSLEEDLVEEIARIVGYDTLPVRPIRSAQEIEAQPEAHTDKGELRRILTGQGYQEIISYSFVDPKWQQKIAPEREGIVLSNPISADLSVMRTTLWSGLLQALAYNLNRQQSRLRLFETGLCFVRDSGGEIVQEERISGVLYGTSLPEQWAVTAKEVDFYDLKGDVERLLQHLLSPAERVEIDFRVASLPALHPGQAAAVIYQERVIGHLGMIHPQLATQLDLPPRVFLFELQLAPLLMGTVPRFTAISSFPSLRRDIAITVKSEISADKVVKCIETTAEGLLVELKLFDVYAGEHIDSGRKSIALGLTLQAESRTLTDDEVEALIARVLKQLEQELGANLRGE
ncbi:MAG: phenylalanine--tRNA ligase subunit beta [Gammaproteobacteria bacterium]|nr:phenylalanine--tRNA ligase subunit beta [Gammaproteobacteria bacterium]